MVLWTLIGGLYLMIAAIGIFASRMERRSNPRKQHIVVVMAGYLCCLLWPVTMVAMAAAIVAGPRLAHLAGKSQSSNDFNAFPGDLHVKA